MRRVGELRALRDERRNYRAAAGNATMVAGTASPSGALVIDAKNLRQILWRHADRA